MVHSFSVSMYRLHKHCILHMKWVGWFDVCVYILGRASAAETLP